jgi:hypothetical protein
VVEGVFIEGQDVLPQMRVAGGVVVGLKGEVVCCYVLLDFFFFNYFGLFVIFLISRRNFFLKF